MENFMNDTTWDDIFNGTTSATDVQMAPSDFDLWDQMFLDTNGAPDLQPLANLGIDSIIATPQTVQNLAASNQEPLQNSNNEIISTSPPASQIYTLSLNELNTVQDIIKERKEVLDMLQKERRELVTVKGQLQTALSEIYTVKSNHAKLLRWTLDMGATMKTLLKWLAENIGANTVVQDGFTIEELGSWLNTDSEV